MLKTALSATREEDYPEWYLDVIKEAGLAESSSVKGCMIIKPWGYALWENMKRVLDDMFKKTGHENAYFPLFIPLGHLQKEADHVEGFATECAVVTHHKLVKDEDGNLVPDGKLAEPLVVRPTSETIIGESFAKWIESYRDLPLLVNQWANVVRWEMRTRPFLRTTEFLWQEGHTAHASKDEAVEETMQMLDVYELFMRDYLAMPVVKGEKTESERFPGAVDTYSVEAMMQNRKALQAGTSHYLGQNFSKASGIRFATKEGDEDFAYTTSWGVSTRMIGALIMTHSDDNGLVLPPKIAPSHVVILPIYKHDEEKKLVMEYVDKLTAALDGVRFNGRSVEYRVDDRDLRGGEKNWYWIKKGVPVKVEIGPRDVEKNGLAVLRRDNELLKKDFISFDDFVSSLEVLLGDIQLNLLERAEKRLQEFSKVIDNMGAFIEYFTPTNKSNPEIHGGFAYSHWCGGMECEEKINKDLSVSIRNIPLDGEEEGGKCILCGGASEKRVVFAKAY
jgi:prolyl-tRNA synthetase